jgi:hypothetical protein
MKQIHTSIGIHDVFVNKTTQLCILAFHCEALEKGFKTYNTHKFPRNFTIKRSILSLEDLGKKKVFKLGLIAHNRRIKLK